MAHPREDTLWAASAAHVPPLITPEHLDRLNALVPWDGKLSAHDRVELLLIQKNLELSDQMLPLLAEDAELRKIMRGLMEAERASAADLADGRRLIAQLLQMRENH